MSKSISSFIGNCRSLFPDFSSPVRNGEFVQPLLFKSNWCIGQLYNIFKTFPTLMGSRLENECLFWTGFWFGSGIWAFFAWTFVSKAAILVLKAKRNSCEQNKVWTKFWWPGKPRCWLTKQMRFDMPIGIIIHLYLNCRIPWTIGKLDGRAGSWLLESRPHISSSFDWKWKKRMNPEEIWW